MESASHLGFFARLDRAVARVEGAIAAAVLLSMVLVASAQALFFNLAEKGIGWGSLLLESVSWADSFLQKGTLAVAFLGASLATHENKHIGIDVLVRLSSPRVGRALRAFAAFGAAGIACLLAWVFFQACLVADAAVPFEYEVLTATGAAHVCDVAGSELGATTRPSVLCALRNALATLHVPVSSGSGIAQLIAPLMLVVMGLRLFGRSVATALKLFSAGGGSPPEAPRPEPVEVPSPGTGS